MHKAGGTLKMCQTTRG